MTTRYFVALDMMYYPAVCYIDFDGTATQLRNKLVQKGGKWGKANTSVYVVPLDQVVTYTADNMQLEDGREWLL